MYVADVPLEIFAECYWEALAKFSSENSTSLLKGVIFFANNSRTVNTIYDVMKTKRMNTVPATSTCVSASSGSVYHCEKANQPSSYQVIVDVNYSKTVTVRASQHCVF